MIHWTDRLYNRFDDLYALIDYHVDAFVEVYHKKLNKLYNKFDKIISKIVEVPMIFYGVYRYATWPTNWIFLIAWKYIKRLFKPLDLLMRKGIHIIMSEPGGGKTLSAYTTIEMYYEKTGYPAAINSEFEKPRTDEFGRKYTRHQLFKFDDIFGVKLNRGKLEGYQKKRFNSRKVKIIVWDELHMIFNPRENRSSVYMLSWKPWLINLLHYRHEGFHSHICLSQLKVDIQLAGIASYIHKPTTIIDVNYGLWMATGKFKMVPVKIKYETYKYRDGNLKLYKKWSRHIDYRHLEYYETLALRNTRKEIPLLN